MWEIVKPYDAQVVSFLLTFASGAIYWFFQSRVRLKWGVSHRFIHTIINKQALAVNENGTLAGEQDTPAWDRMAVESAEYIILNAGRKAATNVEATFAYEPTSFEVWPQRAYQTEDNPNDKFVVRFEGLAPNEQITIHMLDLKTGTPNLLWLRCNEVVGTGISMRPMRVWPTAFNVFILGLMCLGLLALFYLVIQTVGWFARLAGVA